MQEKDKKSLFKGELILIPTPISEENPVCISNNESIDSLNFFIVESIKVARRALRKMGYKKDFDTEVSFFEINKHETSQDLSVVKKWMIDGINIGLMSDAGVPCIADPGSTFVDLAHKMNYKVIPLVGPSSILLGLMASGLNGQNFSFLGYLPIEKQERKEALKSLSSIISKENQTQLFIETPYRNMAMYEAILDSIAPNIKLCIARGIQSHSEWIMTKTINEWKNEAKPNLHKIPTIFLLGL